MKARLCRRLVKVNRAERIAGGIAPWSVFHPIGVVMIILSCSVLGIFALERLGIDLLPHIIYPEIRVKVTDPGVPAAIMEDQVTRHLEEQLAITEDATGILSRTSEGSSSIDLSFDYGKDIDIALRDASTRLDRAKRLLPGTIDPPTIIKRDPSQIAVAEYVLASGLLGPVELRDWADYRLGKWLLNLPGVAAVEVGGGLVREVEILADQYRLAGLGLDINTLAGIIEKTNQDTAGGRLQLSDGEISGRTEGRLKNLTELRNLPVPHGNSTLPLGDITEIIDGAEEERLRIRLDGEPGIKISIQKQPQANTVAVVDAVDRQLNKLRKDSLIPKDISLKRVDDQASYVRQSLNNAIDAAVSGALLAMLTVWIFLGNLKRTLIIGSAIPVSVLVTFILMAGADLTLNIMTLGGLALGIGMLVDNAIVMLENIQRHQLEGDPKEGRLAASRGAAEVNSAIIASTSTNLAAVLPFLFIGGLVGLLFRELIFTISASIIASLLVSLTLTPALAGLVSKEPPPNLVRRMADAMVDWLQRGYVAALGPVLAHPLPVILIFVAAMAAALPSFDGSQQVFLPNMDEGRINLSLTADRGINLEGMDEMTRRIEDLIRQQPETEMIFSTIGGWVFGRSQSEITNKSTIQVRLKPLAERGGISSDDWIKRVRQQINELQLVGLRVQLRAPGIRGIRISQGDDDISLRLQGSDLDQLARLADRLAEAVKKIPGLRNVQHSFEEENLELAVRIDRERAARFGLDSATIGKALRFALNGVIITEFLENDRSLDVRLRLKRAQIATAEDMGNLVLFSGGSTPTPIRLGELASVDLIKSPNTILRDRQQRIVEISASLNQDRPSSQVYADLRQLIKDTSLPEGYVLYEAGSMDSLEQGRRTGMVLLGLALFLVFSVMAVQYESLRSPMVIMLGVPFAIIGVALGLEISHLPLSMPVWLGLIMLAGIVVNNAIVLVEYIELMRQRGMTKAQAILLAARLRLRPILMTTLTTVVGMIPLAMGLGEGAEMLQPLAVTIVSGLSFSLLVSLLLTPVIYMLIGGRDAPVAQP
jgi:multidrug efflux pump subunit AcrB